jgi:hypothetical protein
MNKINRKFSRVTCTERAKKMAGAFALLVVVGLTGCATEPRIVPRATLENAGDDHPAVRRTANTPTTPAQPYYGTSATAATSTTSAAPTTTPAPTQPGSVVVVQNTPPPQVIYVERPCYLTSGPFWGALGGGLIGSLFGGGNGRTFFTLLGATAGALEGSKSGCR